jgi:hypothetical protein
MFLVNVNVGGDTYLRALGLFRHHTADESDASFVHAAALES